MKLTGGSHERFQFWEAREGLDEAERLDDQEEGSSSHGESEPPPESSVGLTAGEGKSLCRDSEAEVFLTVWRPVKTPMSPCASVHVAGMDSQLIAQKSWLQNRLIGFTIVAEQAMEVMGL